ncbi:hypothetical protein Hanom_Chr10g00936021 [Helianthus anomalus]
MIGIRSLIISIVEQYELVLWRKERMKKEAVTRECTINLHKSLLWMHIQEDCTQGNEEDQEDCRKGYGYNKCESGCET